MSKLLYQEQLCFECDEYAAVVIPVVTFGRLP